MAQFKKTSSGKKAARKAPVSTTEDKGQKGRRAGLITAALILVVILVVVGVFYYWNYVKPFQTKVIIIGEDSINIGYFIKRIRMDASAGGDPNVMLEKLTHEILINQGAPRYGIEATEEDIDGVLREMARGESETISDSEYKAWYREQLNETQLSNAEYRELTRTYMLASRLQEYLAERVPSVAEQVHLHIIILETYEDALEVKEELDAGADFAEAARERSLDTASGENGGDIGWVPMGVLENPLDWAAPDLEIGEISNPLGISETAFCLIMVSERAIAREVEEDYLDVLKAKAIDDWLVEEMNYKKIEFHGFSNGFDSETYYWIKTQLAKRE
jgi:parvulin-like peptidyl-prolyl isomerase